MSEITLLDPQETSTLLAATNASKEASMLTKITTGLMSVLDSDASVFVVGLTEGHINSLRTRMYRRNVRVTVRKTERNGEMGHVLIATTI